MYNFRDKTWTRPGDVKEGDAFAVKVVAVARGDIFWQCYMGPSDWTDQRVADEGDLVSVPPSSQFYVMCLREYLI